MINDFLTSGQKEVQIVIFQLGNEEYAVPITCVQEIIMMQPITRIPKSPFFVEGVINLRGHIIPIIDGAKRFQLEDINNRTNNSRIVVLELTDEIIGVIVENVSEVIHLSVDDIEPPPIDTTDGADFILGVGKFQKRLLILLDANKFLTADDVKGIKQLAKVTEILNSAKEEILAKSETKKSEAKKEEK